ncbi:MULTISPECIES: ABC transporter substrate-binding protein [Microbacterium]|uniref:Alpha-glucoside ABC transporter substrate-binding protein n=1 Tax=Microbacterium testaceum TaxID=2033 RepID=A0A4Y3QSK2_MICTE|nr:MULTISPECIES: extracellular solute-binding protein [Microbacterium]MDZ5144752.1 extracellular solute-binding protein [Microbacterium testaceum]PNW10423.1 sugar ABC transporter substrate-binding protein [Microbacterium testaceum]REC98615.1 carbohydrate ABC transporter substrate-binding protein (CUT1 family) [Microbacterium sp. AG157]WJS90202.1 extracellular solute-binding protein [Microbacterium testaceum]GEB47388.1 alpha-glucoside ABC transporter substrate-binding protein [Microbacterium te
MGMSQRYRLLAPVGLLAIGAIALAGCAEGDSGGTSGSGGETTVRISGGITGSEADLLNQSFDQFTKDTGIKVVYTGDKSFEGNIVTKVTGGDAPDIAIVPQPGLLKTLIGTGDVKKASDTVSSNVDQYWGEDWKSYGSEDGTFYAAPMLANLKGYVWYSPAKFKEWGVEIPKTLDELMTLTATIQQKTGAAPWCAGFASGDASGWPGTDWIEDMVLRQSGADVYDKWVANEVKFTDAPIKEAFEATGKILLNPSYVNAGFGDVKSINSVAFADVAAKVADGSCPMTHQASFLSSNFLTVKNAAGQTPTVAPDGDVYAFLLPGVTEGKLAVEGGGEFVTTFSDDANVQKVAEFMSTPDFANARVKLGGVISANKGADPSLASSEFLQEAMKVVQDPNTTLRFDASDLMPATVGSGSFWKGMVSWIDGTPTDQVLSDIQTGYNN